MEFRFENLLVYQEAVVLSNKIFTLTGKWPSQLRFSLGDQLNRAALSISLNIAEGSSRTGKDFQHFLSIARGSCYECVPIITIAKDQRLIAERDFQELKQKIFEISKMLTALRSSLSK
ncbi:MAG TPA: four helix bundle protein [Patescibacteria group bacterium]|jgi:four helix bundle protein|nr:four helix bundle protein [Patescibacteria group bacterium]